MGKNTMTINIGKIEIFVSFKSVRLLTTIT